MNDFDKIIAEVKDPTTGEVIVFEGTSEEELDRQIDEYFEGN